MGDAEGELQLLSGTICPSSCCRLQRRLRLGAPGRRQLQLLLRPPPPRPEHPVRTRYGSVSVSVYGDEDKPALITYPDVALNCSANHRFIYTDLELSNSYLDIGDNGKISCKISSDFVSPRSSFKIRTSCFISLFL